MSGWGLLANALNSKKTSNFFGNNSTDLSNIANLGQKGYTIYNGLQGSGGGGYGGLVFGGLNAGKTALNGGSFADDVPQSFFGINSKDQSDTGQAVNGAVNGAMMGAPFGPVGMAVGAALGLGSSFLDDI